jgi:hypothetical protein
MKDILIPAGLALVWIVLNVWLLPRFGVST